MVASIVTLAQAKDFLNITTTDSDAELPFYTEAATDMWANRGGPVGSQAFDEWYDGGSDRIVLRTTPIISVTSVIESLGSITHELNNVPSGTSGDAWAYTVDLSLGALTRRAAGVAVQFAPGVKNIHVTYTAGYATVPKDVQLAVLLLTKHMWQTQRGIGKRPGMSPADDYQPKEAYSWPNRVEEILAGYKVPGIA